ncbi:type II and III secretion system protein family protein [Yersinia ruckeri]|uniref:type II and III secretion system protein family protein n=1 Tax=Yersinia ruckeri TaxID=29486 RepID=UPI0020C11751|nr:type II and III secretion system protein family protein [Yersinia ruckeri]MCK8562297.1 type II and III secretion system protein family protein [Yersinia ruckeri]
MNKIKSKNMMGNIILPLFLLLACGISTSNCHAEALYLATGESHIINVTDEIDTIFSSATKVADYELIGTNSIIIYAKEEGLAEFNLFDKKNKPIHKVAVFVDKIISKAKKCIRIEYPDSQININKLGEGYILTGTAQTEEARETIEKIVANAIGSVPVRQEKWGYTIHSHSNITNKITIPVTNQVNVKLTIAEVTKDFTDNIGLDWSTIGNVSGSFHFTQFNAGKISTLVQAINDESVARVLAEPNLSVLSGETASFLVGGELPIVSTTQNTINVSYKEFGIKLNIGAKVSESKRIRVKLDEEVSSLDKMFNVDGGSSYPALRTRKAGTTVELGDGESFILGGLISREDKENLKKIPLIGDIPILGALFRKTGTQTKRSELVVIATVNLVKPMQSKDVGLPDFMKTSTLERFFNYTFIRESKQEKLAKKFLSQGGFIK